MFLNRDGSFLLSTILVNVYKKLLQQEIFNSAHFVNDIFKCVLFYAILFFSLFFWWGTFNYSILFFFILLFLPFVFNNNISVDTFYSLPHVNNPGTFYAYLYMNKYLS